MEQKIREKASALWGWVFLFSLFLVLALLIQKFL